MSPARKSSSAFMTRLYSSNATLQRLYGRRDGECPEECSIRQRRLARSPLDADADLALDEPTLEDQIEDRDRDCGQHRARHQDRPIGVVRLPEIGESERQREEVGAVDEDQRF